MSCGGLLGHDVKTLRLQVKQGSSLSLVLTLTDENGDPLDVTGFSFSAHVRPTALSSTLSASFTFDTTNAATGVIVATLSGTATAALTTGENARDKSSIYYYDMRYVVGGVSTYFLQGPLTLVRRVTR